MVVSSRLVDWWPAAGLRVSAGDLELRWIDDDLLVDLAELAGRGVHAESAMPFNFPWTRGSGREVAQRVLTYQWGARAHIGPERLVLELGVLLDGQAVGIQGAAGDQWGVVRQVETGSWLGREFQGRGIGTRMRVLMLHLCFEGLGAEHVTSSAFTDNSASNAISRRTGYQHDGQLCVVREGVAATQHRYRMSRQRWREVREADTALLGGPVEMAGLEPLLDQLSAR